MIKNRPVALTVILLIYVLAVFCGFYTFRFFSADYSLWLSLLIADVAATVLVFIFSLIFSNASVYDPYWSVQPPVIFFALLLSNGGTFFCWLLFAAVLFWALRLTANWAYNFTGFDYQDWRYTMLKEKSGRAYPLINFLGCETYSKLGL